MMMKGREDVAEFALLSGGIADPIGGENRKMKRACNIDCSLVSGFFLTMKVTLKFDVDIPVSEDAGEPFDMAASFIETTAGESVGERTFVAASKADKAGSVLAQFFFEYGAFTFVGA